MVTCAPIACKHRVSGSISLPSRGSFHLSLTVLYAIGHWVVFRLGGWAPRLQTGFHVSGPTLDPLCIYSISSTGTLPSMSERSSSLRLSKPYVMSVRNPTSKLVVWPLSRSLAATRKIDVSFSSSGYLDVSVPRVTFSMAILFTIGSLHITAAEFPHSDICGLTDICSLPQLIAACHVLRRLPVPRHPPCAISHLTFSSCLHALCRTSFSNC